MMPDMTAVGEPRAGARRSIALALAALLAAALLLRAGESERP